MDVKTKRTVKSFTTLDSLSFSSTTATPSPFAVISVLCWAFLHAPIFHSISSCLFAIFWSDCPAWSRTSSQVLVLWKFDATELKTTDITWEPFTQIKTNRVDDDDDDEHYFSLKKVGKILHLLVIERGGCGEGNANTKRPTGDDRRFSGNAKCDLICSNRCCRLVSKGEQQTPMSIYEEHGHTLERAIDTQRHQLTQAR